MGTGAFQEHAMSPEELSRPEEVYIEFSSGRVSQDTVLRASVSHDGWVVPCVYWTPHYQPGVQTPEAEDEPATVEVEADLINFSETSSLPGNELWVFTGPAAAERAKEQGVLVGLCLSGVRGTRLFGDLNPEWEWVRVNPGSPPELTIALPRAGGFPDAKKWAAAITFERAIASERSDDSAAIARGLRRYDHFLVLVRADGGLATLENYPGLTSAAAAFTAPDCLEALLGKLTPEQRGGITFRDVAGSLLVESPADWGLGGIVVNPYGPGPTVVCRFGRSAGPRTSSR
jgi:hypothetical protein